MYQYRPPYNGGYATPWLWYDGDQHGSYTYSTWNSKIQARMAQPAPVNATIWGSYTPGQRSGTINLQLRNDSTASITGRVLFIITEDSLYYVGPNGDPWHNHVARDYIPNYIGQTVTIAPGDSVTVTQSFTLQGSWNEDKCNIIGFIQDTQFQADSTKEVWQGALIKITELAVQENNTEIAAYQDIAVMPNPCESRTNFAFELPAGNHYTISIYDATGRLITKITGTATGNRESIKWSLKDDTGSQVSTGVYFYRFESQTLTTNGKIVVR